MRCHCNRIGVRPSSFPKDPHFIERVRDIVGMYLDAPDRALVLCVDETSEIEALNRTQPLLQRRPGQVERRTHDYKRDWHDVVVCSARCEDRRCDR